MLYAWQKRHLDYERSLSREDKREFAMKMKEIEEFCAKNSIDASLSKDSYYFTIRGQKYRVSNHSVESSSRCHPGYHRGGRQPDVKYIHASKTRIIEIFTDLKDGWVLDGHGKRVSHDNADSDSYDTSRL